MLVSFILRASPQAHLRLHLRSLLQVPALLASADAAWRLLAHDRVSRACCHGLPFSQALIAACRLIAYNCVSRACCHGLPFSQALIVGASYPTALPEPAATACPSRKR